MNKLKNILVVLLPVFTLLSTGSIYATNFVCAQDLDGNGDVTGIGENASCSTVGGEQFCSVGAQTCSLDAGTAKYTCPTAGNSCVAVDGIQKCSINPCIDLDADDTETETSPDLNLPSLDDGHRDVDGACTETAIIFEGKGMRCRYKGWGGLADNCCKSSGKVLSDSTGSYVTTMVTSVAMSATWSVLSAGYTGFVEAYAFFGDVEMAGAGAEVAAQGALEGFTIDPTTIAISLAIKVFMDMMGCEQSEQEAAIYKGSGYCHEIGSFCSKKIKFIGCVERSKGMCCFNSKLARILQEQGRVQMGKDWGSAKNPSCGGFSPNEFQSLDFSRIDLAEYYGDIKSKGDSLIQKKITDGVADYYNQIRK